MIPDVVEMIDMIKLIEEDLHKQGWDNDRPALYQIGVSDDRRELLAVKTPYQPLDHDKGVEVGLAVLAALWESGRMDEVARGVPARVSDAVVGLMFIGEAYASTLSPEERGGVAPGDHPESAEGRFVVAVDVGGRAYCYARERGFAPIMEMFVSPDEEMKSMGPIVGSLAATLCGMTKFAPAGSADRRMLRAWADRAVAQG